MDLTEKTGVILTVSGAAYAMFIRFLALGKKLGGVEGKINRAHERIDEMEKKVDLHSEAIIKSNEKLETLFIEFQITKKDIERIPLETKNAVLENNRFLFGQFKEEVEDIEDRISLQIERLK